MDQRVIEVLIQWRQNAQQSLEWNRERLRLMTEGYEKEKVGLDADIAENEAMIAALDAALAEAAK